MTIAEMIERLDRIGWLDHLSKSKRARLEKDLQAWQERNADWAYLGLATAAFDIEAIEDDSSYPSLIRTYRKASTGVFDAQDIESRLDHSHETAFVAFTLRGHRFEAQFSLETGDYVALAFEPFLNTCLAQVGIEQRFYTLPVIDEVAHLVFVPPNIYAAAEAAGVLGLKAEAAAQEAAPAPAVRAAPRKRRSSVRLRGEGFPLPLSRRAFLAATAAGAGTAVAAIHLGGAPPLLVLGAASIAAFALFCLMMFVQHPFAVLTTYQWMMCAFMVGDTALIVLNIAQRSALWLLFLCTVWVFLVWQGAQPTS